MEVEEAGVLILQILAGAGLAAAAGLRAFLPPLVLGSLARFEVITLRPSLDWMESTPALVVFGSAVVLEMLADKIPWLDHALDVAQTFIKPAAGALVLAATLTDLPPLWTATLAIVVGGTISGGVHLGKAALRVVSTGTTGGAANPVVSTAEDGLSLVGSLMAILFPVVGFLLVITASVLIGRWWMRRRHVSHAPPAFTS